MSVSMKTIVYREEVPLTYWATIMIGIFITVLTPTIILEIRAWGEDEWKLTVHLTRTLI